MDFNKAKQKGVYYKCGQLGHIGRFCPNCKVLVQVRQQEQGMPFDVRSLDHNGIKHLVGEWQAVQDAKHKAEQDCKESDKFVLDFSKGWTSMCTFQPVVQILFLLSLMSHFLLQSRCHVFLHQPQA